MEIIDSVLGVTIVVEIDEGKLVFDCDVTKNNVLHFIFCFFESKKVSLMNLNMR